MRIAVADLGTNSTRLLVADVGPDGRVAQIDRRTEVTRLGEGLDASGRLTAGAIDRVCDVLAGFRRIAGEHGAERAVAVATSAVREGENGSELAKRVRDEAGFDVHVIDGDEEARLTFLGATAAHAGAGGPRAAGGERGATGSGRSDPTLVIDIGGGSTELVVGVPGRTPDFHVSTRLGSVRHTERHLADDPPTHAQLEALARDANEIVAAAVPVERREAIDAGIAVAGTPTSVAAIELELDPYDPDAVDGHVLGLATCERVLADLALVPVAERRRIVGLHPERAPTIVAGVAVLVEAMRLFGLDAVEVSEADILEGAAREAVSGTIRGA